MVVPSHVWLSVEERGFVQLTTHSCCRDPEGWGVGVGVMYHTLISAQSLPPRENWQVRRHRHCSCPACPCCRQQNYCNVRSGTVHLLCSKQHNEHRDSDRVGSPQRQSHIPVPSINREWTKSYCHNSHNSAVTDWKTYMLFKSPLTHLDVFPVTCCLPVVWSQWSIQRISISLVIKE